jgi:cephalosporin hydroxylase
MEQLTIPTHVDLEATLQSFKNDDFELLIKEIRTWKHPDDLDRYTQAIRKAEPEVVIETGTAWGGSAIWFTNMGLEVITIDRSPRRSVMARQLHKDKPITWLVGRSTSMNVWRKVRDLVRGRRVMVSLDSDHHTPNVIQEINLYGPLVQPGGYLVVEDGIFELLGDSALRWGGDLSRRGGPLLAIQKTLQGQRGWTRDVELERLSPVTHSPAGWWRKE